MSERTVYHVVPHSGEGWDVKKQHAERATSHHETKQEAVDHARELCKSLKLAQVIVHKQDGKIETEYTYGDDPFPPPG